MNIDAVLTATRSTLGGLAALLLKVLVIVVPLLILSEWVRTRQWYHRFVARAAPSFARLGFAPQSLMSLLTGLLFGISYGAGVLIAQTRSGDLRGRQAMLVALFLGLCHALPEDTLIFVAVGAQGWILIATRLIAALTIVPVIARIADRQPNRTPAHADTD